MFPVIDKKKTGKRLKQIFKRYNLTPKDIQKYLSLSCVQTVYRWLEGINIPSIDHLYALSTWLELSIDEFIVGNKETGQQECQTEYMRLCMYWRKLSQLAA